MLSQEILNAVDELMSNPMIHSVSLDFMSWHELPEINIQAKVDVSEEEVVSLVSNMLAPVEVKLNKIDQDHIECWGKSYGGKTKECDINLLTFTTKKDSDESEPTVKNFTSDFTINDLPVEEYLKREG